MQKRTISNNKLKRVRVLSRHPSHSILRQQLPRLEKRALVRLGSTTDLAINGREYIEINSIQAIKNSACKLLMKQCFDKATVKTAKWFPLSKTIPEGFQFPLVIKSHYGSRGMGNTIARTQEEYDRAIIGKDASRYLVEQYMNYKLEFRLHTTKYGCFYTCRKALKKDTPEDRRWCMNESTCVWLVEDNPEFLKPNSWKEIEQECVKALNALGLDFCAFDVRVQSAMDKKERKREFQDFIIVEGNSAPSLGNITAIKYLQKIPEIIMKKAKESSDI